MARIEGANLDDAVGFVTLPAGVHGVEINEMEEGIAKSSKERVVKTNFLVLEVGSDDPAEKQKAGGLVGMSISLQPKALWKLRQLRDASGTPSTGGDFFETADFLGRRLKIATSVKPFTDENGKTTQRTNIDDFISWPDAPAKVA